MHSKILAPLEGEGLTSIASQTEGHRPRLIRVDAEPQSADRSSPTTKAEDPQAVTWLKMTVPCFFTQVCNTGRPFRGGRKNTRHSTKTVSIIVALRDKSHHFGGSHRPFSRPGCLSQTRSVNDRYRSLVGRHLPWRRGRSETTCSCLIKPGPGRSRTSHWLINQSINRLIKSPIQLSVR